MPDSRLAATRGWTLQANINASATMGIVLDKTVPSGWGYGKTLWIDDELVTFSSSDARGNVSVLEELQLVPDGVDLPREIGKHRLVPCDFRPQDADLFRKLKSQSITTQGPAAGAGLSNLKRKHKEAAENFMKSHGSCARASTSTARTS